MAGNGFGCNLVEEIKNRYTKKRFHVRISKWV